MYSIYSPEFDQFSRFFSRPVSSKTSGQLKLALAWQLKGRLKKAITSYKNILKNQPDCLDAYQNLGEFLVQDKQFDDAIDCYIKALEHYPNLPWLHKWLIQLLIEHYGIEKAFSHYKLELASNSKPQIQSHTILCCMVVRNESLRLPYWLDYYRRLGVGQFFIVNNDSTDATESYLRSQPDVAFWNSTLSFNQANFGSAWFEVLLQCYGIDHWCLTVDADELFYYSDCEDRDLHQLCADLDRTHKRAFPAILLDMYSDVSLQETQYQPGQDPLEVCSYFDKNYYHRSWPEKIGPYKEQICYMGGMRERIFGQKGEYCLSKIPLIKYHSDMLLIGGQHFIGTFEDQVSAETGALLHFKYIHSFTDYVTEEIERKEHYGGACQYEQYMDKLTQENSPSFYDSKVSTRFKNSQQLANLGIIKNIPQETPLSQLQSSLSDSKSYISSESQSSLNEPCRILIYTNRAGIYGVGRWNHKISMALRDAGYEVHLAQPKPLDTDSMFNQREDVGINHYILRPPYSYQLMTKRSAKDWSEPFKVIAQVKPDAILFANGEPFSNLTAMEVALQQNIPYLPVVHCVSEQWNCWAIPYKSRLSVVYSAASSVVTVSQENLQLLHQHFGLEDSLGEVMLNGIGDDFFQPLDLRARDSIRKELNLPADVLVSLTTARLSPEKGYQYQIAAIRQLLEEIQEPALHFVWVGGGYYRAELEKEVRAAGIDKYVSFLGERHDVPALLDASDLFILTSEFEGMPLAILEAMAKGLPVIASSVSGIPEALGDTGILLPDPNRDPEGTVKALTTHLKQWLNQPESMQLLGSAAKQRAQLLFREEIMFTLYLEKISQMLQQ